MRTPWHIWVVGGLSLLWNAGGAYDYLMTQLQVESYLSMFTAPQRAYLDGVPLWFEFSWATGVWFSILGSLLILLRSAWAGAAFLISLLGLIVSSVWSFVVASPPANEVMGTFAIYFSAAITVVLILLYLYCRAMAGRGHLR